MTSNVYVYVCVFLCINFLRNKSSNNFEHYGTLVQTEQFSHLKSLFIYRFVCIEHVPVLCHRPLHIHLFSTDLPPSNRVEIACVRDIVENSIPETHSIYHITICCCSITLLTCFIFGLHTAHCASNKHIHFHLAFEYYLYESRNKNQQTFRCCLFISSLMKRTAHRVCMYTLALSNKIQ